MNFRTTFSIAAFLMLVAPAIAQEMTASPSSIPGRAVDVRGIVPGTPMQDALTIIEENYPDVSIGRGKTVVQSGATAVQGPEFTSTVDAQDADGYDRLIVSFSGVASGNQVTLIKRMADYEGDDNAPVHSEFVASLIAKYGEPSRHLKSNDMMFWAFSNGQQVACSDNAYGDEPMCMSPFLYEANIDTSTLGKELGKGVDFVIFANVDPTSDRVHRFELFVMDLDLALAAREADAAGLQAELDAALANDHGNAKVPSL